MQDVVLQAQEAAYRYGLKPHEFWALSPYDSYTFINARAKERNDFIISHAWSVANFTKAKKLEKLSHYLGKEKPKRQTPNQMMKQAQANTIMLGGKVK